MKVAVLAFTFAALAQATSPRSEFPACALGCMDNAVKEQTSCLPDDFHCICMAKDVVLKAGTSCVLEKCGLETAESMTVLSIRENARANWLYRRSVACC